MNRLNPVLYTLSFVVLLTGCATKKQAPAPVTLYGSTQGVGSAGVHTVVGRETLWDVSRRYQISLRDIAAVNNLSAPFDLNPGQRLLLPPPREYVAKPGDTIESVAKLFAVNSSEVVRLNNLTMPFKLNAGRKLRLPVLTRDNEIADSSVVVPTPPAVSSLPPAIEPNAPIVTETLAPPPTMPGQNPQITQQATLTAPQPIETVPAVAETPQPKSPINVTVPKRSSSRFLTPVDGRVISNYGPKPDGLNNDGINISAARGTPVKAAENGVVVYAGDELKPSGNLIIIRHQDRWMTAYAHMDKLSIKRGDVVKRGQTIGTVGSTGSVDKPQLHFEVRRGTEAINPKLYLES